MVGIWDGAYEVWVKPWAIDGYITCLATGGDKPLAWRELPYASMRGLKLDSMTTVNPIVAQSATRYAGVGVANRSAGAVLYVNATTWADPTIA